MRIGRASPDDDPGQAKVGVGELGLKPLPEQDLAGLDVSVQHGRPPAVVQEHEGHRSVARDTELDQPGKRLTAAADLSVTTVEPHVEAVAFQGLVDEDAVAAGSVVPEQAHQVRVAEALAVAGARVTADVVRRDA
jgi:hypothetical protein